MSRPLIERDQVILTDGTRPVGAIVPRKGKFEAHLHDGRHLGNFDTVPDARRALLEADKAQRGGA